ncbi:hypothetical protein TNCV_914081 [Trichonephila clavipes]|nr:hypothetical protein TNCV_914081 [Trichonephila clavipes]
MNQATLTYPPLTNGYLNMFFADVNSAMWKRLALLVPHGVEQRRRDMCCAKNLGQDMLNEKLVIMALYRSPLTVTLWPSSFLKKYGRMIPPAHKAHQTVSFSGCNGVSTYTCGLASLQMRQLCLLT